MNGPKVAFPILAVVLGSDPVTQAPQVDILNGSLALTWPQNIRVHESIRKLVKHHLNSSLLALLEILQAYLVSTCKFHLVTLQSCLISGSSSEEPSKRQMRQDLKNKGLRVSCFLATQVPY